MFLSPPSIQPKYINTIELHISDPDLNSGVHETGHSAQPPGHRREASAITLLMCLSCSSVSYTNDNKHYIQCSGCTKCVAFCSRMIAEEIVIFIVIIFIPKIQAYTERAIRKGPGHIFRGGHGCG